MRTRQLLPTLLLYLMVSGIALAQSAPEPQIKWQRGPIEADLGGVATVSIPKGFAFTDKKGTQKLLELNHDLASGVCTSGWKGTWSSFKALLTSAIMMSTIWSR